MKKEELKAKLDELEVEYPEDATNLELKALLPEEPKEDAPDEEASSETPAEETKPVEKKKVDKDVRIQEIEAEIRKLNDELAELREQPSKFKEGLVIGVHGVKVLDIRHKVLNGVDLNEVYCDDGTTCLLSDEDLDKQLK